MNGALALFVVAILAHLAAPSSADGVVVSKTPQAATVAVGNTVAVSSTKAGAVTQTDGVVLISKKKKTSTPRTSEPTATWTAEDGTVVTLTPPPAIPQPPAVSDSDFVSRRGNQLILKGQPWYFVGFNAYWLPDSANYGHNPGKQRVAETMAAAKKLGMRAVRTWAFNSELPAGPNMYSQEQFLALDYIIYCARVFNLRVILALGNFWHAYKSPEDFLWYAMGSEGHGILDFYKQPAVKQLYKSHISAILTRVNRYTGLAYKDDPTIMGYDVLNEPRCPGCESVELQDLVVGWMDEMTRHTKAVAPRQLAALGTEGFFMRDNQRGLHLVNPGAGAQCEGEDWPRIVNLHKVDFSTLHVYERHTEAQPVQPDGRTYLGAPDWLRCGFNCYVNWLVRYVQAHMEAAAQLGGNKPLIIEEFGLTWWRAEVKDRKVVLAVIYRLLAQSASAGGNLVGAMLWNGAHEDSEDQDGYNVRITRPPKGMPASPPALNQLPPLMPYLASWADYMATSKASKTGAAAPPAALTPADAEAAESGSGSLAPNSGKAQAADVTGGRRLHQKTMVTDAALTQDPVVPTTPVTALWDDTQDVQGNSVQASDSKCSAVSHQVKGSGKSRQLMNSQTDRLDGFRRGWERGSCAHEASRDWRPPIAFSQALQDPKDWTAEGKQWMAVPDLAAWRSYAWPLEEVDLIMWGASRVNKPGQY